MLALMLLKGFINHRVFVVIVIYLSCNFAKLLFCQSVPFFAKFYWVCCFKVIFNFGFSSGRQQEWFGRPSRSSPSRRSRSIGSLESSLRRNVGENQGECGQGETLSIIVINYIRESLNYSLFHAKWKSGLIVKSNYKRGYILFITKFIGSSPNFNDASPNIEI